MPDIEKAYHILVAAASDSLDLLEAGNVWETRTLLQAALLRAEDAAIRDDLPGSRQLCSDGSVSPLPRRNPPGRAPGSGKGPLL